MATSDIITKPLGSVAGGRKRLKALMARIITPEIEEQLLLTWVDAALGAPPVLDDNGKVIDSGRAPDLGAAKYLSDRVWGKTPSKDIDDDDMLDRINSLRIGLGYDTNITEEEWATKYVVQAEEGERPPGGIVQLPVIDVDAESEDAE